MNRYYLALGDSITAGYGVGSRNFAALYYSYLIMTHPNLRYINYGVSGLTTGRLTCMLRMNVNLQQLVAQAAVITLTIGSNDLLHTGAALIRRANINIYNTLSNMEKNLDIIGLLIRRFNPTALVKVVTIYNPLPAGTYRQYTVQAQRIITQANKIILHWAKKYGFRVVPIDKVFQGREHLVIGPDYAHPNSVGHHIMAMEMVNRTREDKGTGGVTQMITNSISCHRGAFVARVPRIKSKNGIYHILMRGINRQTLFEEEEDCAKFI